MTDTTVVESEEFRKARKHRYRNAMKAGLQATLDKGREMDEAHNVRPEVAHVRAAAEILREAVEIAREVFVESEDAPVWDDKPWATAGEPIVESNLERIEKALASPDIVPEAKERLESAKLHLEVQEREVGESIPVPKTIQGAHADLIVIDDIMEVAQEDESVSRVEEDSKEEPKIEENTTPSIEEQLADATALLAELTAKVKAKENST
jgi:hypothetical protein